MMTLMLALMLVAGSEDPQVGTSRAEEAQQAREEKAQQVQKPERNFLERALYEFKERRVIERFQEGFHGFHPLIGGMPAGSGFAGGTSFEKDGIRASVQGSLRGFQKYEVQFAAPPFISERFFADFRATHRNYPQQQFFGAGKTSRVEDRTGYRLEDTNYVGRVGFTPAKHVRLGVHAGRLNTNAGSGTDRRVPSTETVFGNIEAPAIAVQPNYLHAGAFFEIDYRDKPQNPRAGGRYAVDWTSFLDRKLGRYGFSQYDIEVNQYFPLFNQRRVFALRGKSTLTHTAPGQDVPFFMQPTLGGADDLRGFREYRFRDRNMIVLNAEYRWEAFSGLDLALFADAGQVAARPSDIHLRDLETSYGAGFRFNTSKKVFLRMDIGRSREGTRVFLKFSHAF